MADKIINTDTMIGKVIAVMVALLFVVILAFPVANSLGNMGKEDDGGGAEPITYTNTGDFYYKSATADSEEHILKVALSPGSSDATMKFTVTSDGATVLEEEYTVPTDDIYPVSEAILLAVCEDTEKYYLTMGNSRGVMFCTESGTRVFCDSKTDASDMPYWEFIVQNGKMRFDGMGESKEYDCSSFIASSGEYVLANTPVYLALSSKVTAFGSTVIEDSEHGSEWQVDGYATIVASTLNDGSNTSILGTNNEYVTDIVANIQCAVGEVITVSNISVDITMDIESRDSTYTLNATSDNINLLVPVTVTVGSDEPVTYTYTNVGEEYYAKGDADNKEHIISITTVNTNSSNSIKSFSVDSYSLSQPSILAFTSDGGVIYMDTIEHDNRSLLVPKWRDSEGNVTSLGWSNYGYSANGTITLGCNLHISNGVLTLDSVLYIPIDLYYSYDGDYIIPTQDAYVDKQAMAVYIGHALTQDLRCFGAFDTSILTQNEIDVPLTIISHYEIPDTVTITSHATIQSEDVDYVKKITAVNLTTDIIDEGEHESHDVVGTIIVPKSFSVTITPESGSESGSDGLGNVASTLVKLVPILLIVGIILVLIVPMIQNRMQ